MEQIKLISIVWIILILLLVTATIIVVKYIQKKKQLELEQTKKVIRGFLVEDNDIILHGDDYHYNSLFSDDFDHPSHVYIKYYAEYKKMLLLAYIQGLGYVLQDIESDTKPKYYYEHEVFIGIPRETYVEGYLNEENDFVITKNLTNE